MCKKIKNIAYKKYYLQSAYKDDNNNMNTKDTAQVALLTVDDVGTRYTIWSCNCCGETMNIPTPSFDKIVEAMPVLIDSKWRIDAGQVFCRDCNERKG